MRWRPVLLGVVRPTLLPGDVKDELFIGLRRTNCDFVAFEAEGESRSLLNAMPPKTTLLECPGQ